MRYIINPVLNKKNITDKDINLDQNILNNHDKNLKKDNNQHSINNQHSENNQNIIKHLNSDSQKNDQ